MDSAPSAKAAWEASNKRPDSTGTLVSDEKPGAEDASEGQDLDAEMQRWADEQQNKGKNTIGKAEERASRRKADEWKSGSGRNPHYTGTHFTSGKR
jgi:hypothetical protein